MEYNEIPTAIKSLKGEVTACGYVLQHDIPRYGDARTGKIKVQVGDRTINVDVSELKTFVTNQMAIADKEIERLEGIHDTLTKVAVGLIK